MTETMTPAAPPLDLADEVRLRLNLLPPPTVRHDIRTRARVSLRRFGKEIGVSHGSVRYYERGGEPGIDIAVRYCAELYRLAAVIGFDVEAAARAAARK